MIHKIVNFCPNRITKRSFTYIVQRISGYTSAPRDTDQKTDSENKCTFPALSSASRVETKGQLKRRDIAITRAGGR